MKAIRWTIWLAMLVGALGGCSGRTPLDVDKAAEPPRHIVSLSAAGAITCALRADQTVTCLGGALGTPTELPFSPAVELAVGTTIGAGANQACVRTTLGRIECVAVPHPGTTEPLGPPFEIAGVDDAAQISVGPSHACVLHQGGLLECWGDNSLGQLGNGTFTSSATPTPVGLAPVRAVSAGDFNTCALTDAGVFCWGRGGYGALGDGSIALPNPENEQAVAAPSPVYVVGLDDPRQVTASLNRACAIDGPDGIVKCWGLNVGPMLAGNTYGATAIDGLDGRERVFSGYLINCATRADKSASCWGTAYLGDGTNESEGKIADLVGLSEIQSIAGGWDHTCALVAGGEVYCWGANSFGQLGPDVEVGPVPTPIRVSFEE